MVKARTYDLGCRWASGNAFWKEVGLRKIFERFGTLALLGTYCIGTMGLRPVTMLLTDGQRLGL